MFTPKPYRVPAAEKQSWFDPRTPKFGHSPNVAFVVVERVVERGVAISSVYLGPGVVSREAPAYGVARRAGGGLRFLLSLAADDAGLGGDVPALLVVLGVLGKHRPERVEPMASASVHASALRLKRLSPKLTAPCGVEAFCDPMFTDECFDAFIAATA